jgi:hypothetical protein
MEGDEAMDWKEAVGALAVTVITVVVLIILGIIIFAISLFVIDVAVDLALDENVPVESAVLAAALLSFASTVGGAIEKKKM